MRCPECETDNQAGRRFCTACGRELWLVCPACGARNEPGAGFCGDCGARLGAPGPIAPETLAPGNLAPETLAPEATAPAYDPTAGLERLVPKEFAERLRASRGHVEAERRQVTILFCDVKGFTAMAEALDPEDVLEIMNGAFEHLIGPVYRHEGTLAQLLGDAILAFFGAPIGHEDDPQRAVRAALDIQAGIREYAARLERERGIKGFSVRVGINTGLVVVGEVGTDLRVAYTAIGDAINLAARMEQNAPPGGILVSESTNRYVRDAFHLAPQPPLSVKGHARPAQTYLVERPREGGFLAEARGVEGIETRMVGRSAELSQLQAALRTTATGSGARILVVVGEAGVGKTRLVGEFERWAERDATHPEILLGRATTGTLAAPYGLLRDIFARRFGILGSDSAATARDRFEAAMVAAFRGDAAGPMRAHLIGQLIGYDFADSPHLRGLLGDARQIHDRARAYLADYLRALTAEQPALIILEDLHWADDSTLDTLLELVDAVADSPVLFMGTSRTALDERRPGWGSERPALRRLNLRPLSVRASQELVLEILQKADEVPDALRDLVVATAEGIPFFAEELIKMLLDDGVIQPPADGSGPWHIAADRLTGFRVPPSLTGVLQARLDRLEPAERIVVQQASVVGRRFWDRAVARLGELSGGAADGIGVAATLATLQRKGLVFERDASTFAGCREYLFKHALLRDVAYESLLRRQRRSYHGAVADWLVETGGDRADEIAGLVGSHLELAGRAADAADHLARAAARAAATFANDEAIRFYRQALELVRDGQAAPRNGALAAKLGEGLGDVLHLVGEHAAARDAYRQALASLAPDQPLIQARLLRKTANAWVADRAFAEVNAAFENAERALSPAPDADVPGEGTGGPIAGRLEWWREWIAVQNDRMLGYYWQARVDELDALVQRARPAVERYATPAQRAGFFQALLMLDFRRYRYLLPDEAIDHATAYLAASEQSDDPGLLAFARFVVGFAFLWHGDQAAAEEQLTEALALSELSGDVSLQVRCVTYLTVLCRERGQLDETRALAGRSLELATAAGMPEYVATAYANEAWLAWRDDDPDAVERCGRAALELWPPVHASSSFRWTALWPLIGAALSRDDTGAAVGYARGLLEPSQQRMAGDLHAAVEAAVQAWDEGDKLSARGLLTDAAAIARPAGRL
jgi:class 3 adenylate cyclase/tetratricopeptide (TPR) repeat protein